MKRFLVFAGDTYYPSGGAHDFIADLDTFVEAEAEAQLWLSAHAARAEKDYVWAQIWDTAEHKITDIEYKP